MGTGIRIRFLSFVRVRDKGVSPSLSLSLSLSHADLHASYCGIRCFRLPYSLDYIT